jgi:hypothetical protein
MVTFEEMMGLHKLLMLFITAHYVTPFFHISNNSSEQAQNIKLKLFKIISLDREYPIVWNTLNLVI